MATVTYTSRSTVAQDTQRRSQLFKGFSTQSRTFEDSKLYDIELVKQDVFNHFNIRKGEKLENPEFGTNIWQYLFDPLDDQTKNAIVEDVQTVINYDPRVTLDQLEIDEYEHGIQITLTVLYIGYGIGESFNLLFDQNEGLLSSGSNIFPASA
jgi:phage baseplate assembly protein W